MSKLLLALTALLTVPGCAGPLVLHHDEALTEIPHRSGDSGHIIVDVMINESGPYTFALDTGASITVIYQDAGKEALVQPIPGVRAHVLGMTGSGMFPVAMVEQISVGAEKWNSARVALLPQSGVLARQIDGILGVDFLSRYAILYSQKDRILRLYPKELVADRSYLDWNSIGLSKIRPTDSEAAVYYFEMVIDGERFPTIFDLGATINVMNREAARRLDVSTRAAADSTKAFGVIGETPILAEVLIWRLRVEQMYWRNRRFLVGDFPIFEALDLRGSPIAISGTSLFAERDFVIDFAGERLLVKAH